MAEEGLDAYLTAARTRVDAVLARELGVEHVVVGLPLDPQGTENPWCAEVREVGRRLGERLGVAVSFVDERFTSARAVRAVRAAGATISRPLPALRARPHRLVQGVEGMPMILLGPKAAARS
jgi:RNase H-fold protein (predicted Holliday junction resolvase)